MVCINILVNVCVLDKAVERAVWCIRVHSTVMHAGIQETVSWIQCINKKNKNCFRRLSCKNKIRGAPVITV